MRTGARVVVIGGGVVGCSLLYHLAKLGWRDTLLLEKNELTAGSTWHAAGLCTQFSASLNITRLLMYGVELYKQLEAETGQSVDFREVGSIRLATVPERLDHYRDQRGLARIAGLPFEIIGPEEIGRLCPILSLDNVLAGAWTPTDGYVDPSSVTQAMAKGARDLGAEIQRHTPVRALQQLPNGEWDVVTDAGTVRAEIVVNAGGMWGRDIGKLAGVDLPIVPMEHQYLVTDAIPALVPPHREMPVVRDVEASFYVREEAHGLIVGPYERNPKPWSAQGIPPDFGQQLLAPDFDQIEDVLNLARSRIPALESAGLKQLLCGPTSYTPDGNALMGWVPGLRNFFVLTGFSYGIVQAGGAGRNAAEWIVEGEPTEDMWELDVRRFGPHAAALPFVIARASEVYEREYAIPYPFEELPAGRPLKTDPLYDRLAARGAVFGARNGWERPMWFVPHGQPRGDEPTYRVPGWLPYEIEESRAVRERAGLLDMTSFAKYEVRGPGAEGLLDRLCANRLPQVGRAALTQMLTPRGGIECDVTITRLAEDRFYVITAAATETHDLDWIERHAPSDGSVVVENVTDSWGVLMLAGPRSREVLGPLTEADLSNRAFPFMAAQDIVVGSVPVRALRVTYTGELGWELHHPIEHSRALYNLLTETGAAAGLADIGYRALDSLRLEKGYRLWGVDITSQWTPLEAGLERFVRFDKGDFIGREALIRQRDAGISQTLACLTIDLEPGDSLFPRGGEPVLSDDKLVGYLRAAHPGHAIGTTIGLSYLPVPLSALGTPLEVEILGERRGATVVEAPLYDREGARMRG
ncbi:MAG TPA: FAD-dependent oxidoreductase [Candidatus Limnocylindrales bacterium]|nr:FAD-dependent oxidoreductase [Candidatus Limnocylindrales bacterium]